MPMRKIDVASLRPGMKFSKSLFDNKLNIVLPAGKRLDEYTIKNLKIRNVDYVETAGEIIDDGKEDIVRTQKANGKKTIKVDKETAKYLDFYRDLVSNLGFLLNKYKNGELMDVEKLQRLSNDIVNAIMVEKNQNLFINLINITRKGNYLYNHIINTAILSVVMGKRLGYSMVKLFNLALAALTYDIGMIKIPAYIIEKEDNLTPEEFNMIKTHPIHSYQIITKDFNLPVEIARVGLEHHERYDGTGYPRRLKGIEISEMARIISIIDTYEALTKDRVYRERKDSYEAMKHVLGEGSKKFDPEFLKVFLTIMSIYPVGSYVRLNNNAIAKVIASDPVSPFRPTIKIVIDEFGDKIESGEVIQLSRERDLYIVQPMKREQIAQYNELQ